MVEKLYQSIEKLSGSEARNLLVNMMIKIKNMQGFEGFTRGNVGGIIFFI